MHVARCTVHVAGRAIPDARVSMERALVSRALACSLARANSYIYIFNENGLEQLTADAQNMQEDKRNDEEEEEEGEHKHTREERNNHKHIFIIFHNRFGITS